MKPITNLLIAGFLLLVHTLVGQTFQTSFSPTTITAGIGEQVSVQFRVTGFTNINSVQLPITYNASVLRFDSLDCAFFGPDDPVLPGYGDSTTASHPNAGKVVFTWYPNLLDYPDGYTLPANTRLFTLRFTVIGNGTANINVTNMSPGIEVIQNGNQIPTGNNNGSTVTGGNGQPQLVGFKVIANQIHIPKDHVGCMPITVNDFDSMWSMQFAMHWDPLKIKYECTRAYNLPDLTSASFGGQPMNGTMLVGWADPNQLAAGASRADGAKIFDVCFTAIGSQNTNAIVTIDGIGFPPSGGGAEAINSSVENVWESVSGIADTAYIISQPPPSYAVKYAAGKDTADNNAIACVPVKVANHSNITNAEYIITVNGTQLAFQSIDLGANPMGLVIGTNFNTAAVGRVRFTYNNAAGVTLPNDATIFKVCYTVGSAAVAPQGTLIPVNVTSAACAGGGPFPVGVSKKNFGGYPIQIESGSVLVGQVGPPDATFAITHVTCFGLSNGAINTSITNGGTATGYNWSGPAGFSSTQEDLTGLAAGTYVVTITMTGGSTIVRTATVTAPTALTIPTNQVTITPVKCTGETNGAISLTPSGGTSPYTYVWTGPNGFTSTSNNLTNLDNGTYIVTVTDNKGCTLISQQLNVLEAATLLNVSFNSSTNVKCLGTPTGTAQITVSGGQTPYAFSWRDFNNLQVAIVEDPTNLPAGIYNVIVTDAFGCTKNLTTAVTITAPPSDLTVNSLITNVVCNGYNTGAISLTISGGWPGPAPTVTWSPILPPGPNAFGIPANIYTASVTDAGGCVTTHVATVTEPAAIQFDTVITEQAGGSPTGAIDLIILSGGVAPLGFAWSGPNGFTAATEDISGLEAGPYTVTITDAATCTRVIQLAVPTDNVLSVVSVKGACSNDGCINLQLTGVAVAPYIITLTSASLPGGQKIVQSSDATPNLCDLPAGFYSINVADANSNVYNISAVQVVQLEQALVTVQSTNPTGVNNNGSIILTHSFQSDFGFVWNTGAVDSVLTGLAAGTYTVTVTNIVSECTAVYSYTLTVDNPLSFTSNLQSPNCLSGATGTISIAIVGGTAPYIFSWTGPNGFTAATQNLSGLYAGTYFLTISDQSGTTSTSSFPLTAVNLLAVADVDETSNYGFGFQVSGAENCDGAASVEVSNALGNVSVQWSNGETGFSASALCGGQYSVTVSDQTGCTAVWSDNLLAPSLLAGTHSILSNFNGFGVSCFGACDGYVRFFPSFGVPPYKVTWSTGQIDQNIPAGGSSEAEELCGGDNSVTITDFLGATRTVNFTIPQPAPLVVEFSEISPTTFNSCDGEILASVPGAVGAITATWSGSFGSTGDGPRAEDLCAGEVVQFVIEDANGCIAIGTDTLYSEDIGCMKLRPVITPALQDGKNDFLLITCAESTKNHIEIYNRWGQLVFQTDNYDNASRVWTGLTEAGQPLAEGVYYYVLTYDGSGGEEVVEKGHINLLR